MQKMYMNKIDKRWNYWQVGDTFVVTLHLVKVSEDGRLSVGTFSAVHKDINDFCNRQPFRFYYRHRTHW